MVRTIFPNRGAEGATVPAAFWIPAPPWKCTPHTPHKDTPIIYLKARSATASCLITYKLFCTATSDNLKKSSAVKNKNKKLTFYLQGLCVCESTVSMSAGLQVKLMKLMTNVFKEQRTVEEKREWDKEEKVRVDKRETGRILHWTPTERRRANQKLYLIWRLGGVWPWPIMIWRFYDAAEVHHLEVLAPPKADLQILNVTMISERQSQGQ